MPSLQSFASTNRYSILDSGATGTFVTSTDAEFLVNKTPVTNGPSVLSANGTAMPITVQGQLPLSKKLSSTAQAAFVLDDLKTGTLISLAQLCDDDCIAIFNKYDVKIMKDNQVIIQGSRMPNGLWSLPLLHESSAHQANGILRTDKPKQELAQYHHASLGSPAPSTVIQAIRKTHLTTFPGLTTNLISKHLPKSLSTVLGHQDQEAKHLRSTKILPSDLPFEKDLDLEPELALPSHHIFSMLFEKSQVMKSYSDQTGRFPVPSSRGNNYIFVLYHYDTNTIHAVAIPNRQAASIRNAWETVHKKLIHQGHAPNLHILDNECSQELKDSFAKYNIAFQRVPPKEHRANAAERAIRTFKNHLISTLCSVDSNSVLARQPSGGQSAPPSFPFLNKLNSSRSR